MIYIFENPDLISSEQLRDIIASLPQFRRDNVLKYYFERDRKLSAVAYMLLYYGLYSEFNIREHLEWGYEANEKPYLLSRRDIDFNISHCKDAVCCAISNRGKIGVDVESHIKFEECLVQRIANESEYTRIKTATSRELELTRLWTKKESWLKYTGIGIDDDLKNSLQGSEHCYFTIREYSKYLLSVCYKREIELREIVFIGAKELRQKLLHTLSNGVDF